jgi:predicted DNA-binding helix-hairpin-helix protein
MNVREELDLLGRAAVFDDCTTLASDPVAEGRGFFAPEDATSARCSGNVMPHVSHVTTPDGRSKPVLKILQTSACQNDCHYCAFRAGRDVRRAHVTPDDLARSFDLMYRAGLVDGMFLSSGIIGTIKTMDEMLATTELMRGKYGFRGYIHLKVLPAAEPDQVLRAVELADRVSVNLEGPTPERLAALAPIKNMADLLAPLRVAAKQIKAQRGEAGWRPAVAGEWGRGRLGMSTQFVVGAVGDSDRELLSASQMLYHEIGLARAYYSAFRPVRNTPLEGRNPTSPTREHRLYQADWLLRYYGFGCEELPYDSDGLLAEGIDPKAAWARAHPERFPIEVNRAPVRELLRVPGIGPHSARAIVAARGRETLREIGDMRKLGARADHAAPYILLAGKRPPYQPPLPF